MKRVFILFISFLLAISLISCSSNSVSLNQTTTQTPLSSPPPISTPTQVPTPTPTPEIKLYAYDYEKYLKSAVGDRMPPEGFRAGAYANVDLSSYIKLNYHTKVYQNTAWWCDLQLDCYEDGQIHAVRIFVPGNGYLEPGLFVKITKMLYPEITLEAAKNLTDAKRQAGSIRSGSRSIHKNYCTAPGYQDVIEYVVRFK